MINTTYKIAHARIQGKAHLKKKPPVPCQDFHTFGVTDNGNIYIILSDGAGSSLQSHIASAFCVKALENIISERQNSQRICEIFASDDIVSEWQKMSFYFFEKVRNQLFFENKLTDENKSQFQCTLMLIIQTPNGFLSAHVGDGRAGFYDNVPHALIVPFMTFVAGATCFLAQDNWHLAFRTYINKVSDVNSIKYFFASTDGCQDFIIDKSKNATTDRVYDLLLGDEAFYDSNLPFHPFFEGLLATLNEVNTETERNDRLLDLINNGIYILNNFTKELKSISSPLLDDDKTFVLYYM